MSVISRNLCSVKHRYCNKRGLKNEKSSLNSKCEIKTPWNSGGITNFLSQNIVIVNSIIRVGEESLIIELKLISNWWNWWNETTSKGCNLSDIELEFDRKLLLLLLLTSLEFLSTPLRIC